MRTESKVRTKKNESGTKVSGMIMGGIIGFFLLNEEDRYSSANMKMSIREIPLHAIINDGFTQTNTRMSIRLLLNNEII